MKWCSEYARSILRWSGVEDMRYCKFDLLGCLDWVHLSEASNVADLIGIYSANEGWIDRDDVRPTTPQPGDYVALEGSASW